MNSNRRITLNRNYKGVLLILLSATGFGLMPVFALFAYKSGISVPTLLFIRFGLAALLLLTYVFVKFKGIRLTVKDIVYLLILGGVCYTLQSSFYFSSVRYISPSLTALLLYTYPVIVAVLSFFLEREKITLRMAVSMAVSFAGLLLTLGASIGKVNMTGVVLALAAAVVYSVYIVIGNRVVKKLPSLVTTAFVSLFAALGLFGYGVAAGQLNFGFDKSAWLPIIGLILFCTILAILTFFKGLELLGPMKASILSTLEPVFAALFSAIFLFDRLTFPQLMGGVLVLAGAVLIIQAQGQKKTASE
jgi:drug/metabolite transporter (DMT)-like permease